MGKKMSTYYTDNDKGHCEVHADLKNEMFYIKYFDRSNRRFYTEEFPNKSYRDVCGYAEDWTQGYYTPEGLSLIHI